MALEHVSVCVQVDELIAGEVGYLAASIKAVADARVGDTITQKKNPAAEALAGPLFVPLASCALQVLLPHAPPPIILLLSANWLLWHTAVQPPSHPLPWDQVALVDGSVVVVKRSLQHKWSRRSCALQCLVQLVCRAEQYTNLSTSRVLVCMVHPTQWCNSRSKAAEAAVCVWDSHHLAVIMQAMFR